MKVLRQGGFLISKIHQLSGRIFAKKLKDKAIEINPAQGRILFALWEKDDISIQELAGRTALGKSTLTRMLDGLEASGHVQRVYPGDDRRKVLVRLTEENKKVKESYEKVSADMADLYYAGFSDPEIEAFEGFLKRLLQNLVQAEKNNP